MKKLAASFDFAWQGIIYCIKTGRNFRLQLLAAGIAVIAGFCFSISKTEWIAIIIVSCFVLVLEMLNTAIEKLCDEITTEIKPTIKIIKDVSAGAVLLASIAAIAVGLLIFVPKIL